MCIAAGCWLWPGSVWVAGEYDHAGTVVHDVRVVVVLQPELLRGGLGEFIDDGVGDLVDDAGGEVFDGNGEVGDDGAEIEVETGGADGTCVELSGTGEVSRMASIGGCRCLLTRRMYISGKKSVSLPARSTMRAIANAAADSNTGIMTLRRTILAVLVLEFVRVKEVDVHS